ncbi:MarR family transcriptional regulator [Streptomyces sp. YC504]|uniref:MarR family transcriptional regulator n=1 Tax=Streptomyces mesophilus TaxID=1775132 RepID=A0A6G4XT78_9ACTN|nr:MarR family transcriptional regulator [Streptomyces mesophilus]NGO80412.1 MarR family transcriptional regulator [Streptomyces mesophilus]
MTAAHDAYGPGALDALARALGTYERDRLTGTVRVSGRPGGVLGLRRGLVLSARSPGAPDLETRLLRSGRGTQGGIGAAELRMLHMRVLYDAVFAMAVGQVTGCAAERVRAASAPPGPGHFPSALVRETARRLAALERLPGALERLPGAVAPCREPLLAVPMAAGSEASRPGAGREILALADGRRTARDIAFRTGRGLYTTTVEATLLLGRGLIIAVPPGGITSGPGPADLAEPLLRRLRDRAGARPPGPAAAGDLPRRVPGASGRTRKLAEENSAAGRQGIYRRAGRIGLDDPG